MFQKPMSSDMIMTMLGLCGCAAAGVLSAITEANMVTRPTRIFPLAFMFSGLASQGFRWANGFPHACGSSLRAPGRSRFIDLIENPAGRVACRIPRQRKDRHSLPQGSYG